MSYDSNPNYIQKKNFAEIKKGVDLQLKLQKQWETFKSNKSNAKEVLKTCEELIATQEATKNHCGGLGPNQVKLRAEYAKDAISKGQDAPKETFKSGGPFKQYINKSGHKVTVLK